MQEYREHYIQDKVYHQTVNGETFDSLIGHLFNSGTASLTNYSADANVDTPQANADWACAAGDLDWQKFWLKRITDSQEATKKMLRTFYNNCGPAGQNIFEKYQGGMIVETTPADVHIMRCAQMDPSPPSYTLDVGGCILTTAGLDSLGGHGSVIDLPNVTCLPTVFPIGIGRTGGVDSPGRGRCGGLRISLEAWCDHLGLRDGKTQN